MFDLLIQVGTEPLSKIIQNLGFRYTRSVNQHRQSTGHLFQGRYKAILVDAGRLFMDFTCQGIGSSTRKDFHNGSHAGQILGDDHFADRVPGASGQAGMIKPPTLKEIIEAVCSEYAMDVSALYEQSKGRDHSEACAMTAWVIQCLEGVMMLDADVVAVSPSSIYRVLKAAGLMRKWERKKSKKGSGFHQPSAPHKHWHIDVSYLNICGTFYYFCGILDGYSRYIVHWEIRQSMTESDIEIILERAREKFPNATPRIISDKRNLLSCHVLWWRLSLKIYGKE